MHPDLTQALERSAAVEQIAELLYDTLRGDSILMWDEAGVTTREWYRARARQSVRSCLDYAVAVGVEQMAHALARADGKYWDQLRMDDQVRYQSRALDAHQALRFHLAEVAYPESEERAMAEAAKRPRGRTLGAMVDETRVLAWKAAL